jgi:hypothetical protein
MEPPNSGPRAYVRYVRASWSDRAIRGLDGTTVRSLHALAAWRAVRVCLGQLVTLAAADTDVDRAL